MQGIWRRRELQWRVPDSQSLLPGSNIFFGRVFSDLSHAFGFQNVCTMCLPNCYSVRFSSILYDSGFKTRILSISKLSSSKKGLIASLAITYNLTLKHVEAAHKKILQTSQFQRLEDVRCRSRHGTPRTSKVEQKSRAGAKNRPHPEHGSNMDSVDMLDGQISAASGAFANEQFFHCLLRPTAETGKDMQKTCHCCPICRWSSAGAQLQWLNASLSSITDEHLLLKSHLQDVFSGRLPAGCRCCCFSTYRSVVT